MYELRHLYYSKYHNPFGPEIPAWINPNFNIDPVVAMPQIFSLIGDVSNILNEINANDRFIGKILKCYITILKWKPSTTLHIDEQSKLIIKQFINGFRC